MKFDIFHLNDKILALYPLRIISNVTSNKNELERLFERLTSFQKCQLQYFLIFFEFVHPFYKKSFEVVALFKPS